MRILQDKGPGGQRLSDIYYGALVSLRDTSNPDRLALVSHGMREFTEKAPAIVLHEWNWANPDHPALTAKVNELVGVWTAERDKLEDASAVGRLAEAVQKLLDWKEQNLPKHESKFQAALTSMDPAIPASPAASGRVAFSLWINCYNFFVNVAHHRFEVSEDEVVTRIRQVEVFLLAKLMPKRVEHLDRLDKWLSLSDADISSETVAQLQPLLASGDAQYDYFFNKLMSPAWLQPLLDSTWFLKRVPPDGDWPQTRYLARIADRAPEAVMSSLVRLREVANLAVREDCITAALKMPPSVAVQLLGRILEWTPSPDQWRWPELVAEYAVRLSDGGYTTEALRVCRVLLALKHPDRQAEVQALGEASDLSAEPPRPWCEQHVFEQIVANHAPRLLQQLGLQMLELLCKVLRDGVERYATGRRRNVGDIDWWLSSVRHADGHTGLHAAMTTLVAAIRDASLYLVNKRICSGESVCAILASQRTRLFRRIAMNFLADLPEPPVLEVARVLLDQAQFSAFERDPETPEYARLLEKHVLLLSKAEQDKLISWLDSPPDWADTNFLGERIKDEVRKQWTADWRLRRMRLLEALLDELRAREYRELLATSPSPAVGHPRGAFAFRPGKPSPKSVPELLEMGLDDLLAYIAAWVPGPDEFGLVGQDDVEEKLAQVSEQRAGEFVGCIDRFVVLKPAYQRSVIRGLGQALKQSVSADWLPAIAFCQKLVAKLSAAKADVHDDSDSRWTGQEVAHFLEAGMRSNSFASESESAVWQILESLAQHPDPTPEVEAMSQMDAPTLALNHVRPLAILGVIEFGLWQLRVAGAPAAAAAIPATLDKVRELLDHHLDVSVDTSRGVRSVYGRLFPWLLLFGDPWSRTLADKVFPLSGERQEFLEAAWGSYIAFTRAYDPVLEPLRAQYRAAVLSLSPETHPGQGVPRRGQDQRLAQHLMFYVWRGRLELTDELLAEFWTRASAEIRAYAMDFIGDAFRDSDEDIPQDIMDRVMKLWESRKLATDGGDTAELAGFGSWFGSGRFPDDWSLDQLEHVVSRGSQPTDINRVFKQLALLADTHPVKCVDCCDLLIRKGQHIALVDAWRKEIVAVVKAGLASSATAKAKQLVDHLVGLGLYHYRELLRPSAD